MAVGAIWFFGMAVPAGLDVPPGRGGVIPVPFLKFHLIPVDGLCMADTATIHPGLLEGENRSPLISHVLGMHLPIPIPMVGIGEFFSEDLMAVLAFLLSVAALAFGTVHPRLQGMGGAMSGLMVGGPFRGPPRGIESSVAIRAPRLIVAAKARRLVRSGFGPMGTHKAPVVIQRLEQELFLSKVASRAFRRIIPDVMAGSAGRHRGNRRRILV